MNPAQVQAHHFAQSMAQALAKAIADEQISSYEISRRVQLDNILKVISSSNFMLWCKENSVRFTRIFQCAYCLGDFPSTSNKAWYCPHIACPKCVYRSPEFCSVCKNPDIKPSLCDQDETSKILLQMHMSKLMSGSDALLLLSEMTKRNTILERFIPCFACNRPCREGSHRLVGSIEVCEACNFLYNPPDLSYFEAETEFCLSLF